MVDGVREKGVYARAFKKSRRTSELSTRAVASVAVEIVWSKRARTNQFAADQAEYFSVHELGELLSPSRSICVDQGVLRLAQHRRIDTNIRKIKGKSAIESSISRMARMSSGWEHGTALAEPLLLFHLAGILFEGVWTILPGRLSHRYSTLLFIPAGFMKDTPPTIARFLSIFVFVGTPWGIIFRPPLFSCTFSLPPCSRIHSRQFLIPPTFVTSPTIYYFDLIQPRQPNT